MGGSRGGERRSGTVDEDRAQTWSGGQAQKWREKEQSKKSNTVDYEVCFGGGADTF